MPSTSERCPIGRVAVSAFTIPTDESPESDGTAVWTSTTLVLVQIDASGQRGIGWTYESAAAGQLISDQLADLIRGENAFDTCALWLKLTKAMRNTGRSGLASYAIGAIDIALWNLRARLVNTPLCDVMGSARQAVPIYGSGGFTSYEATLQRQLEGWAALGLTAVKMKVGRDHAADPIRVAAARAAIGPDCQLFVDGNGGYSVEEAIAIAHVFAEHDVVWFEQPVDHMDLAGTNRVRALPMLRASLTCCKPMQRAAAVTPAFWQSIDFAKYRACRSRAIAVR